MIPIYTKKNIPKTAIFGASGFLGSNFLREHRKVQPDCIATQRTISKEKETFSFDLLDFDIRDLPLVSMNHKEALIFAGISQIAECEKDKQLSWRVNVEGTLKLIKQLTDLGIKPIFFSSDYVFDGNGKNYLDSSPTSPQNEYGKQKAEVESKIEKITKGNYLVVRLSKVFSLEKGDGTLLDEMASILFRGGKLRTAYDQIFCPTLVSDVINAVVSLQCKGTKGIVNVCSPETWSRSDITLELAKSMNAEMTNIQKISIDDLNANIAYPKNTSMKIDLLLKETNCAFTPISECIDTVAKNWKIKKI